MSLVNSVCIASGWHIEIEDNERHNVIIQGNKVMDSACGCESQSNHVDRDWKLLSLDSLEIDAFMFSSTDSLTFFCLSHKLSSCSSLE